MRGRETYQFPLILAKAGTQAFSVGQRSRIKHLGPRFREDERVGRVQRDPSSDRPPTGHLLPQGEKGS